MIESHDSARYGVRWYTVHVEGGIWTANTRAEAERILTALCDA